MAPPETKQLSNVDDILSTLETQARHIIDRIGHGDDFDKRVQQMQEKEVRVIFLLYLYNTMWKGKYQSTDNTKSRKRKRILLPKNEEISR